MGVNLSEEVAWVIVSFLIATALVVTVSVVHYFGSRQDDLIAELVREGYDPIELGCIYNVSSHNEAACLLLTTEKFKNKAANDVRRTFSRIFPPDRLCQSVSVFR